MMCTSPALLSLSTFHLHVGRDTEAWNPPSISPDCSKGEQHCLSKEGLNSGLAWQALVCNPLNNVII